jgi:PAS domain S-box-containing protein
MCAPSIAGLEHELREVRVRLAEAEETLRALRSGEVDALVESETSPSVYAQKSAAEPYRVLVEQMREGVLAVSRRGTILYCNEAFANIADSAVEALVGTSVFNLMARSELEHVTEAGGRPGCEMTLKRVSGCHSTVIVSAAPLSDEGIAINCLAVTDLTRQPLRAQYEAVVEATVDGVYSLSVRPGTS